MWLDFNPYDKKGYTKKIHYYWFMPLFTLFIAVWFAIGFFVQIFAVLYHLVKKLFK